MSTVPPTTRDIAKIAGCSAVTVSKVFNNYTDVAADTRERILSAAASLGYSPDPALSALIRRRWTRGLRGTGIVIGLLWVHYGKVTSGYHGELREGIIQRAEELGYTVSDIEVLRFKSPELLERHLQRAGITTLICMSIPDELEMQLSFENYFQVFFFGHTNYSHLNQIRYDWMYAVDLAVKHALAAGYKRIGFITNSIMNSFEERILKSSFYLNYNELNETIGPQPKPLVYHALKQPFSGKDYAEYPVSKWKQTEPAIWFHKEKPDVIIGSDVLVYHMFKMAGIRFPQDAGMISLREGAAVTDSFLTAVSHNPVHQGTVAANLMHHLIQTGQRGLLQFPIIQSVEGKWVQGETIK